MGHRRFWLRRAVDVSGMSGTGIVAEGVQFSDGSVTLHWNGAYPSTVVWDDLDSMLEVHGHDGTTVVCWLDPGPPTPENSLLRAAHLLDESLTSYHPDGRD